MKGKRGYRAVQSGCRRQTQEPGQEPDRKGRPPPKDCGECTSAQPGTTGENLQDAAPARLGALKSLPGRPTKSSFRPLFRGRLGSWCVWCWRCVVAGFPASPILLTSLGNLVAGQRCLLTLRCPTAFHTGFPGFAFSLPFGMLHDLAKPRTRTYVFLPGPLRSDNCRCSSVNPHPTPSTIGAHTTEAAQVSCTPRGAS